MIDRVLIAEDHESVSISIQKTLEDLKVKHADYVFYCDDALSKIITSDKLGQPYDLLIVDLYFEEDGRPQKIKNGIELITAARNIQPALKALVFSAENKATIIESLFNEHDIDGYVRKARNDSKELKMALEQLSQNRKYLPRHITQLIDKKNTYEFTELDIEIISLLASGVSQKNIPAHLEEKRLRPSGLSSIEKRLKQIRTQLDFTKNEQVIAFCKDMGII
jgi:two-component system capsular synthesis response regulator RcsB